MPTLAQATSSSAEDLGLAPASAPSPFSGYIPPAPAPSNLMFVRCATPPVSVSPDLLRVSSIHSGLPQNRILSVPTLFDEVGSGSGNTVYKANVFGLNTGGGSGTAPVALPTPEPVTLTSLNTAVVTPKMNQNQSYQTSVALAKSYLLYKVSVNSPARVQFYSSLAGQRGDAGRTPDTPVALAQQSGLVADLYLALPAEASWVCSPVIPGFNGEFPATNTGYITVTNLSPSTSAITVSVTYLPLES